jgi:site-specific DNA-methyltransferase (adenine-specific)
MKKRPNKDHAIIYYNGWRKEGVRYVSRDDVKKNLDWLDKYKIFVPKAWGSGNMHTDWLNPFFADKNSCCTETYLLIGPFDDKETANNVIQYTQTKFFHFMIGLTKITQNTMQKAYSYVPLQDFNEGWTDQRLYQKYGLSEEEINFIESMIRPME